MELWKLANVVILKHRVLTTQFNGKEGMFVLIKHTLPAAGDTHLVQDIGSITARIWPNLCSQPYLEMSQALECPGVDLVNLLGWHR